MQAVDYAKGHKNNAVRALKICRKPEMYGHINSAFCVGMATTVTAAHHFIWRHLYASMQAAQTPASKLRFVTPDKESSMSTLWQEEEFKQMCSRELMTEKAANIEKTIALKEHERARYDFDPTMFYENRFWNWRPDGIVINKYHRTLYILELKRSSDRKEDFLRVGEVKIAFIIARKEIM